MNIIFNFIKSIFTMTFLNKLIISFGIFIFFFIFRSLFSLIISKLFHFKVKSKNKLKKTPFYKPLCMFFIVLGLYLGLLYWNFPDKTNLFITKVFRITNIILITQALANCLNKDSLIFDNFKKKLTSKLDNTLLLFLSKIARVIVYALGTVIIINELGYDVNGIIAGIGLGGLTVALAAQDLAKNIFGGIVIIFDKPFIVGDWIKTSSLEGIVEDITFRSTRIRTFENSVITGPNNTIANDSVINWSKMYKRRVKQELQIEYGTSLDKIKNITTKINDYLINHPGVNKESINVRFEDFKEDGLNILICYFTNTTSYDKYLQIKEDVNMNILNILDSENVSLAFKTQTIHLKK